MVEFEIKIREGGFNAGENLRIISHPKKMEKSIFRAGGMLKNGEHRRHCAAEVVCIKGHDNMNGGGVVVGGGG